jgi:hypothetical protein
MRGIVYRKVGDVLKNKMVRCQKFNSKLCSTNFAFIPFLHQFLPRSRHFYDFSLGSSDDTHISANLFSSRTFCQSFVNEQVGWIIFALNGLLLNLGLDMRNFGKSLRHFFVDHMNSFCIHNNETLYYPANRL